MKIEHIIAQYLYTNKKVTLQDIGTFHLSANITLPGESDKDSVLPDNAISFDYNMKAVQDDGLIDFIVQQTRKIKPLATSDLESFTILGRQFMNIGKPLPIEGLGILQKNQLGEYEFIQGHTVNSRLEPIPAMLREKNKEEIVFTTPARKQQNVAGILVAIIIFLVLAGAAALYFVMKDNKEVKTDSLITQKPESGLPQNSVNTTTIVPTNAPPVTVNHADGFKIVLRDFRSQATSDLAFEQFTADGHKLIQFTQDSFSHKIAMPFSRPLSDTTLVIDSLGKIFSGKLSVQLN